MGSPSTFMSEIRDETTVLNTEAQQTFIHGQFVSTLMVSIAYCEQTLSDIALAVTQSNETANNPKKYISKVKTLKVFSNSFWEELERLKLIRNAYAHRKWTSVSSNQRADDSLDEAFIPHPNSLTARTRAPRKNVLTEEERDKKYPTCQKIIEQDAKDALILMKAVNHVRHKISLIRNNW